MKRFVLLASAACASQLCAQGLYNIAPNDDEASESLPLNWVISSNVGFDDNPTPLFGGGGNDDGAAFVDSSIRASLVTVSPQTTYELYGEFGVRVFLDDLDDADDVEPIITAGLNITHRVNERLRLSSRNAVSYQNEPDFNSGIGADRRAGSFFRYSTNNSVGYRWSERLATVTGVDFTGVVFEEGNNDFTRLGLRQQFRYRVSPQTVLTAGYRYGLTDSDNSGDTNSHSIVGGIERRINPTSAIVLRAGAQITDPDQGDSRTTPFVEGSLRSQLTEKFGIRSFFRYSQEEFNRTITEFSSTTGSNTLTFGESETLRAGLTGNYSVNPRVSLFGGANWIFTQYDDELSGGVPNDGDELLFNFNAGISYQVADNFFLTGSYNFTHSDSDFDGREYDRNRYTIGTQFTF